MAERLVWSEQAIADLESIAEYISKDSPRYAESVVRRIVRVASVVSKFPRIGKVVPEFDSPNIRELQAIGYRVIYRPESDQVVIVAVIHGRRDLS